jgi:hypothetical protein
MALAAPKAHAHYALDASLQKEIAAHAAAVRDIVHDATRTKACDGYARLAGASLARAPATASRGRMPVDAVDGRSMAACTRQRPLACAGKQ